jgi:radical SAM superfamily enzyme YgiQ (UPF0313 family)
MKILLISPPFYRFLGSVSNDVRLSLGYLSAVLRKQGHEVAQYNPDSGIEFATQKELFDATDRFAKDIVKPHHAIYQECYKVIEDYAPDIVGMTVLSGNVIQTEILAKYCHDAGIRVIVGGPMVTLALDKMMEYPFYDQLIPGEAEEVMFRALRNSKSRVVVGIPTNNLDSVPYPDRDNYIGPNAGCTQRSGLISMRGCPFHCRYCAHWILGGAVRYRSTQNIMGEIEILHDRYNQTFLRFFDDTFVLNRARVVELCSAIIKREWNLEFLAETRVQGLDESILSIMYHAGLRKLKLGIESGSQAMLDKYKQGTKLETIREIIPLIKKTGIEVHANWLYGFPDETNEDLQATINLIHELDCDWNTISSLAPYPGTELFEELDDKSKASWKYFYHNVKQPVMNKNLSMDLIEELLAVNDNKRKMFK